MNTESMITPLTSCSPCLLASLCVKGANHTPNQPLLTLPLVIKSGTIALARSIGIAKPTPTEVPVGLEIAAFTPIASPLRFKSGPPEFPGFMEASVWI